MNQVSSDSSSRSTKRMSNSNSTAINIAFLRIQSKSLSNSQVLRGKCLIHLWTEEDTNDVILMDDSFVVLCWLFIHCIRSYRTSTRSMSLRVSPAFFRASVTAGTGP